MSNIISSWEMRGKKGAARLRALYEFLYSHLYFQYEPSKRSAPTSSAHFVARIEDWLAGLKDENDRWAAFRSIEYLFFAGVDEFSELYRVACDQIIIPWAIDLERIDIFNPNASEKVAEAITKTWVCPVTDSLRINSFLHLTGIAGKPHRPDWHSLSQLGDVRKIKRFVAQRKIERLVLLEDFSGSGRQFSEALKFASRAFDGEILAIPLIVCHPGDRKIRSEINSLRSKRIKYVPVTIIPESCLVSPNPVPSEPKLFTPLRKALLESYQVMGRPNINGKQHGYSEVGSMVALYSNCPNNTPPMFHKNTKHWKALFPRANRY